MLSLQILERGCPLQVAGPGESGLGHLGWYPYSGVGRQRCQSQLLCPAYVHQHKLEVRPISELDHTLNPFRDRIPLVGLGDGLTEPFGFTLMRVQIEGMPHYDEQQVVFVLDDPSRFSARILSSLAPPLSTGSCNQ